MFHLCLKRLERRHILTSFMYVLMYMYVCMYVCIGYSLNVMHYTYYTYDS